MNYHTLLEFPRKDQNRFFVLTIFFLGLSGMSICFAQQDQSITMTTNKDYYVPGDTVQLTGIVTGQPNTLVALQVKDSDGNLILIRTIQADQNGNFAIQFKIPPTATSGKFSVTASAKVNGFVVTQDKVFDAKVPEFSFTAAIMLASFVSMLVLYRIRIIKDLTI
jgi:hypothetical protein